MMEKRTTIHVYDSFLPAWDLFNFLSRRGLDVKLVRRYALQVDPKQVELVQPLLDVYDSSTGQERIVNESSARSEVK